MKFLVRCTVLSSILSTYSCSAFSSPSVSSELTRIQSQKNIQQSFLPSTLIDAADTTISSPSPSIEQTMQQQIDAQQKKVAASYLDDGFVFGLDGSGLERPKGKEANVVVEGDSLETTPQQIGIVFSTFVGQFLIALNAISQYLAQTDGNVELTAFTSLSVIVASWVLADFGSGVFHWSVDNYGNGRTPVMGSIIAAFQGHHSAPWTITYRGFCNNVWKLCIPFGLPTVAAISYIAGPENSMVTLFFTFFCAIEIMSQELHKWSHMTKKETPAFVNTLQALGVTIARVPHAQHHLAPYDGNYCIVSGLCNETLDKSGFFRWMEHKVYELNGVESNAWKLDPELRARTLRGEYQLPASQ
mmetsp:Transcript_801/g.1904  ORF Transcript_801/g.1904 Transcript_801/m.1904 type:complete len:358 (-) Transcript_801:378-1451(-)